MSWFGLKIVAALLGLLALVGCSSADLFNLLIPTSGYKIHKNIAYGDAPREKLDIYVPDKPDAAKSVIVFIYGGSWQRGSKDDYRFVGQALTSRGYTVVIPDYRLYPEVYYPSFVEDNAKAVVWTYKNIRKHGGNNERLFLAGHSAGAYNAVMLAVNDRFLQAAGGNPKWISGTIGLAGPYNFLPIIDPKIQEVFSKPKDLQQTQPITFAGQHRAPMLLALGTDDDQVDPENTRTMAAKLKKQGNNVTVREYDVGHIGIVLALANGFRGKAPVLDDIDNFIKQTK